MHTPGTLLENNRYYIQELLGEGGFGRVYRAVDQRLQQDVAIKETTEDSADFARQFAFEAQVLAGLSHPALPIVSNYFNEDNRSYLVMSYVPGETLKDYLNRQPGQRIGEADAIRLIEPIVAALEYLHSRPQPIIHRDIKPGNVRITPDGRVFLVDFGLAKAYDPNQRTTMGARALTPGYSPLEQYGVGITDARSDLYAVGATLYHMVTGVTPPQSIQRTSTDPLVPPRQMNPSISPAFEQLILQMMMIDPAQRSQSASEVAQKLQDLQRPNYCTSCGTSNRPTSQFCVSCGARMHPSGSTSAATASTQQAGAPSGSPLPPAYVMPGTGQTAPPAQQVGYPPPPNQLGQPGYPPPLPTGTTPPGPAPRRNILPIIGGVLLVLVILGAGATWGLMQLLAPNPGNDPTSVAQQVTRTPRTTSTPDNNAQIVATVGTLSDEQFTLFGPEAGSLIHEENGKIESDYTNVSVQDFLVEARFTNPYAASERDWDYGFMFRHTDTDREYRMVIDSEGIWKLILRDGSDSDELDRGRIDNLRVGSEDTNTVRMVVEGSRGYLFVNDQFISELDVADKLTAGDIGVATGIYVDHEREGAITIYRDFTIAAIGVDATIAERSATQTAVAQATSAVRDQTATAVAAQTATAVAEDDADLNTLLAAFNDGFFGPVSGNMPHEEDGYIETFYANIADEPVIISDFVADARFSNPYDPEQQGWDYGYIFRENDSAEYHLIVTSAGTWNLLLRPADEESITVSSGNLGNLDTAVGASNSIRLVASGADGYLLVNDRLISKLDLSENTLEGEISVATGLYADAEIEGETTPFSDFRLFRFSELPIAFSDSFDSNANNWPDGQYDGNFATTFKEIENGVYAWRIEPIESMLSRSNVSQSAFSGEIGSNFSLSTVARVVDGAPEQTAYGLFFRYNRSEDDVTTYYLFRAADDSTFQIRYYDGSGFTDITEWESTSTIRPGEFNQLAVVGNGTNYRFLINGEQVYEIEDDRLSGGQFGLAASVFDESATASFEFDDIELRQIP